MSEVISIRIGKHIVIADNISDTVAQKLKSTLQMFGNKVPYLVVNKSNHKTIKP